MQPCTQEQAIKDIKEDIKTSNKRMSLIEKSQIRLTVIQQNVLKSLSSTDKKINWLLGAILLNLFSIVVALILNYGFGIGGK